MNGQHTLRWVAAESFVSAPVNSVPSILRFASDDFMDRMLDTLAQRPQDLVALRAKPETWKTPLPPARKLPDVATGKTSAAARALTRKRELKTFTRKAEPSTSQTSAPAGALKLYQPVHQRFYLAAAHLVCELPGLPPRKTGAGDRSAFVIRRVFTENKQSVEHGFVKGADGRGVWVPIAHPQTDLARGEDLLPVFPLGYAPPNGPARMLMGGLIPVAQHDNYVFAARVKAPPLEPTGVIAGESTAEQLKTLARTKIIAPWQALITMARKGISATKAGGSDDAPWVTTPPNPAPDPAKPLTALNDQLIEGSWRVLQEMREWFDLVMSDVPLWPPLSPPDEPRTAKQHLVVAMMSIMWKEPLSQRAANLIEALGHMDADTSQRLDETELGFPRVGPRGGWPSFRFPLAWATSNVALTPLPDTMDGVPSIDDPDAVAFWSAMGRQYEPQLVGLLKLIHAAIDEAVHELPETCPQAPFAAELAKAIATSPSEPRGVPQFVLRFVHVRCDCGPLSATVISDASERFELAGFFDPDAPIRPLRIALPFDTTPGGLRKFSRGSAFIASDILCGQIKKIRELGFVDLVLSVLPWPFHKDLKVAEEDGPCGDGPDRFGMICSLSIPIITIVAFVLLIVIAAVLDLIFRWLPFLLFCFPVRGLKAKS